MYAGFTRYLQVFLLVSTTWLFQRPSTLKFSDAEEEAREPRAIPIWSCYQKKSPQSYRYLGVLRTTVLRKAMMDNLSSETVINRDL